MGKKLDGFKDKVEAVMHDQVRRTGISAERIDRSLSKGVAVEVVTLQVNMTEQKNNPKDPLVFSEDEIIGVAKFYRACKRRPVYTQTAAGELERNQEEADGAWSTQELTA